MADHRGDRERTESMGREGASNGAQGSSSGQEEIPGDQNRGDYGGAASGEGQGEFGGDGYSNQGQFTDQRAPQYPEQGFDRDYGSEQIGWQQGYEDEGDNDG
jgi:hypothetical protein